MKKSINITLGGLVFSLEEDAYEMLKKYLDSIKEYYEGLEEKEILADIESSIAEKFTAKLKSAKQAITLADVEAIIKIMGTVKEIAEEEETDDNKETAKEEIPISKKRLFRDTDDVVIAGVASGIAAYFGIDPVFVRIIFVILALANGIGILAYIIFWIAMPKATSNTQKLEMRGKPVNLAEIQQVVKEKSKMISEEGRDAIGRLRNDNAFRKILNFPVRIIEIIFQFLKKIIRFLLPAASIFFGVCVLIGSIGAIIGLSIAAAIMVFNINSPYLVSDLPLAEIAAMPFYYVGIISLYAVCAIPMIFASALGITMIRRKNSFNLIASSMLIGVWMVTIVIFVVAAIDIVPMVKTRVTEINRQDTITKTFDYKDFKKLYLGGYLDLKITKGDKYAIKLSGKQADLDRLLFNIEEGQLQITQKAKDNKGICVFCFDNEITGEIIMPELNSFVGIRESNAELKGFDKDLYVSLGETADAKIEMKNQNLTGSLSGVGSVLKLSGIAKTIDLKMDGSADLVADELKAQSIKLVMSVFSRADLEGSVGNLEVNMKNSSELDAINLVADNVIIKAGDYADADIWVKNKLIATTSDSASVNYGGEPKEVEKQSTGNSDIGEMKNVDGEIRASDDVVFIKTDVKQFSPTMSSIRGIGLTPELFGTNDQRVIFRFSTNQGYLIEDWDNPNYVQEIDVKDADQKIYWTYLLDEVKPNVNEPIYIYLEARPEDEDKIITSTQIEFSIDDQGMVRQKVVK